MISETTLTKTDE